MSNIYVADFKSGVIIQANSKEEAEKKFYRIINEYIQANEYKTGVGFCAGDDELTNLELAEKA